MQTVYHDVRRYLQNNKMMSCETKCNVCSVQCLRKLCMKSFASSLRSSAWHTSGLQSVVTHNRRSVSVRCVGRLPSVLYCQSADCLCLSFLCDFLSSILLIHVCLWFVAGALGLSGTSFMSHLLIPVHTFLSFCTMSLCCFLSCLL